MSPYTKTVRLRLIWSNRPRPHSVRYYSIGTGNMDKEWTAAAAVFCLAAHSTRYIESSVQVGDARRRWSSLRLMSLHLVVWRVDVWRFSFFFSCYFIFFLSFPTHSTHTLSLALPFWSARTNEEEEEDDDDDDYTTKVNTKIEEANRSVGKEINERTAGESFRWWGRERMREKTVVCI